MKALILAAGRGTRIRSVHGDRPKCLIGLNDSAWTILDHQIDSLLSAGVSKICIVVGYEMEQIVNHVQAHHGRYLRNIQFIANRRFAETNNIYSLWLARESMKDDSFICLNADVVFDPRVLAPALRSRTPITMIVDPEWRDETMKVIITNGRIVRMSKGIPESEFSGTYLGITAFSKDVSPRFFKEVETRIQSGHENDFFNTAVQQLADEGVHVGYSFTGGLPWAEIDDPGDLTFARRFVFPELQLMERAA
jgi:choline kinase